MLYYVAPNNGLLSEVIHAQGVEAVYLIEPKKVNSEWRQGTFDGRDLYSPAGAKLAASKGDLAAIGRPAEAKDIVMLEPVIATVEAESRRVTGVFIQTDEPYGNVWTNIDGADLERIGVAPGDRLRARIGGADHVVPFVMAFGDVAEGESLAYLNSNGHLALAVNLGDLRREWKLREGSSIIIERMPTGERSTGAENP